MLKFSVTASGDGLGAKLRFDGFTLEEWNSKWAGASSKDGSANLSAFLEKQGLDKNLLRQDSIKWICETLSNTNEAELARDLDSIQGVEVAQGTSPINEEPEGLTFHYSYLSNAEAISELRRKADAWGFGGIRESIDPAFWIYSGATVISFQSVAKGVLGRDIFGSPIPFLPLREQLPAFGKSLRLSEKKVIAICEGALILEAGSLKILGGDSLPTCQVVIAEDLMTANLILGGNYLNDWAVNLDMVHTALRDQNVMCMMPEAEILVALDKFNLDNQPISLLVARGRPAVPGIDGHVHMLVDPEPEVPLPGVDGSIDFKEFSFFRTVAKGACLAEVRPPIRGEVGMNVKGEAVPSREPKPFATEPGRNTELSGVDPVYLLASTSGRLAIHRGIPEVVEVLDVAGDVSLKTGNIEFPGAVKVAGDVQHKMQIQAIGDIEVEGTVEDSFIRSDGAIVIKGGVNGLGQGIIKSRLSSVTIGYLHNQRIESHSHIVVFNEILNSQLLARKTITMKFGKYTVVGSSLLAGEGMDLFNVGSETGNKTILEVGKDFEVEAEMIEKNTQLQVHRSDLEFLRGMDDQLVRVLRIRRASSDEDQLLQKRIQGAMQNLNRWIEEIRKQLVELASRLYSPDPCSIVIRGWIYPETVIKYRENILVVPSRIFGRKWTFRPAGPLPLVDGASL